MELLDAYDEKGRKTGAILVRGDTVPDGLFHAVAEVVVINKDGKYLLTRRSLEKPNYPGKYVAGAGGSVVYRESFLEGAKRELFEETGIRAEDDDFQKIYYIVKRENHTIYNGYVCHVDIEEDSIVLEEGETMAYKWLDRESFLEFVHTNEFLHVLRERLKDYINTISN